MKTPSEGGFSYIGVLMLLATLALTASSAIILGAIVERRSSEEELLRIGAEYRAALRSYANAGGRQYPESLNELLRDTRFAQPRRHLRQIYADPMTGRFEWGVVPAPGGAGIAGIYSLSAARPIKLAEFEAPFHSFSEAKSYQDWVFTAN